MTHISVTSWMCKIPFNKNSYDLIIHSYLDFEEAISFIYLFFAIIHAFFFACNIQMKI